MAVPPPWPRRLLCALLLAAAAPATGAPVHIAGVDYLGDLPTVIADRRGLFAEAGVEAAVSYGTSGRHNLGRLREGDADFALMALTPLVLDHLRDDTPGGSDDPVILASLVHSARLNHVVALRESGIRTAADLAGRRIGLVEGTNAAFAWWLFARYHRRAEDFATVVAHEPRTLPEALLDGEVDAAIAWEPWIARLEERLGERLVRLPHGDIYTAKWVLVTQRETVAQRPGLCRRVLGAYHAAVDTVEREPDASLEAYARQAGLQVGTLRARWNAFDYDLNLDWSVIAALQQQVDWARRTGHIEQREGADLLSLIADAPLRAVAPAAVGIPPPASAQEESTR